MIKNLKKLRTAEAVSQAQLAKAIGTTQQNINKYENYYCNPSIEMLIRIADYFHTSVDYLIGRAEYRFAVDEETPSDISDSGRKVMEELRSMSESRQDIIYQAVRMIDRIYTEPK